jgi:IS5 family transposase
MDPMRILQTSIILTLGLYTQLACADELLPQDRSIESAIDHYVDSLIASDEIKPADQVDDLNLVRRLTLDFAGRIPTTAEAKAFAESKSPNKRAELIDRLLASPDFPFHNRNQLDLMLLPNKPDDGEFRKYLLWASKENRKWDRMFRDMLIGDESDEYQKAAMTFLKSRVSSNDDLTIDTSSLFFGINVGCAKCHDHPLVDDWKQDHFYGMSAFFSRTYMTKKNTLAEKHYGEVKFKTTAGVEKKAKFMFLSGSVAAEPERKLSDDERKKLDAEVKKQQTDAKAPVSKAPEFKPRQKLVEIALDAENNGFFAKNITNRVWHRMFGRGIVDPPDQVHSENPASHPQLLEWLARDTITNGFDLKRLMRGIAMSNTYSRSSAWTQKTDPPSGDYFAVAIPRVMTPRQYALSMMIATRNPDEWAKDIAAGKWAQVRESYENQANGWFRSFETPSANFQVAVDEALLFSNSKRIQDDFLRDGNDRLVGYVKETKDQKEAIDNLYWAICSRPASDEERSAIAQYLEKRKDDQVESIKQVVWALLSGPEIRFNY